MNRLRAAVIRTVQWGVRRVILPFLKPHLDDYILRTPHIYGDSSRVDIAPTANVNNALFNVASGRIVVEDHALFGHNVCLITGTHDYEKFDDERHHSIPPAGRDILIGRGAWVGTNSTVLGPCIIGEHSVVAAGAVVVSDVPAHSIVAGVPARKIKDIMPAHGAPPPSTAGTNALPLEVRS